MMGYCLLVESWKKLGLSSETVDLYCDIAMVGDRGRADGHDGIVMEWLKQTDDIDDIEHMCDIAMDGDRGIVDKFSSFQFDLQSTIAKGDSVCRVVISKKE